MGCILGTRGNDQLYADPSKGDRIIGGEGNDTLGVWDAEGSGFASAYGGAGDDFYMLQPYSKAVVADSGGADTLQLPCSWNDFMTAPAYTQQYQAVIDAQHYLITFTDSISYGFTCLIRDFQGQGRIETIGFSDGTTMSFDTFWSEMQHKNLQTSTLAQVEHLFNQGLDKALGSDFDLATSFDVSEHPAVPAWFDQSMYMWHQIENAHVLGTDIDLSELDAGLVAEGYQGIEGRYRHFAEIGQWNDISPVFTFNAWYYYRDKAADFYGTASVDVTTEQVAGMRDAIRNAGMNAWTHYERYGTSEGIDPSQHFDTTAYMRAKLEQMRQSDPGYTPEQLNQAFADAGLSAVAHYHAYGVHEGIPLIGVQQTGMDIPAGEQGA